MERPKTSDETIHIDSQMLEYLIDECGLVSFEVVEGLVSKQCLKGEALFGRYVNPLYREKARQDALKEQSSPEYNVAMREACKLLLNSLTGKLVEDSSRYYKVAFTNGDECERKKGTLLNGLSVVKVYNRRAMDDDGEEEDDEAPNSSTLLVPSSAGCQRVGERGRVRVFLLQNPPLQVHRPSAQPSRRCDSCGNRWHLLPRTLFGGLPTQPEPS
jgi:hypothetical protein